MRHWLSLCALVAVLGLVGCGGSKENKVMEDTKAGAAEDYAKKYAEQMMQRGTDGAGTAAGAAGEAAPKTE
jgi:hypothetical protein